MVILRMVLTIIYIIICTALAVLVLLQEGKSAGLGTISGAADTYWGKNKGRSMEGTLVKITKYLAFGFLFLALILNMRVF
jgi:preprotein translocase subunit SecG